MLKISLFKLKYIYVMRQFFIILGLSLMICSCGQPGGDATEVGRGAVTSIDSDNRKIVTETNGVKTTFWLFSVYDKMYDEALKTGDAVYVFRDGDTFFATKANLMRVRTVRNHLDGYSEFLFTNVFWWLFLTVGVAVAVFVFCYRKRQSYLCAIAVLVGFLICSGICIEEWTVNARLEFRGAGYVTGISDDVWTITAAEADNDGVLKRSENEVMQTVLSLPRFIDKDDEWNIAKGDYVFLYNYVSQHDGSSKGCFAASKALDEPMLRLGGMYPESLLRFVGMCLRSASSGDALRRRTSVSASHSGFLLIKIYAGKPAFFYIEKTTR